MVKEDNIFWSARAALIDMDGVLYDSMPGHTLAWQQMMQGLGVECTREEFYLYEGMTGVATIDLLFHRAFGHGCEPEKARELYAIKSKNFREMGAPPRMPGADRMLRALRLGGMERVLVTGSGQASLLDALDRDYPRAFRAECRVTAHDVSHGKPDPEPYLMGAAKAGFAPSDCIVIENAPLGVRAGKAAGCFTIAVTTGPIPREEFEREGADMIFPSMPAFAEFLEEQLKEYREEIWSGATEDSSLIRTDSLARALVCCLEELEPDRVALLTDLNVRSCVLDADYMGFFRDWLSRLGVAEQSQIFTLAPGEEMKSLPATARLWQWLGEIGATRRSMVVNLGGGVVSDLGGFVAATFKRGIRFVNVPTTLLAAADAAIGGKTGVDFNGLKNEIGVFAPAAKVIVSPQVLATLPEHELRSGFAEIVKMALLTNKEIYESLLREDALHDPETMARAMRHAAAAKEEIVRLDPKEKGLRRILNLGHTYGHAYESYAASIGAPISHGMAVAHGILKALEMSRDLEGFPAEEVTRYKECILFRYYPPLTFGESAEPEIRRLMAHDKKNPSPGTIRFILLTSIAHPVQRVRS